MVMKINYYKACLYYFSPKVIYVINYKSLKLIKIKNQITFRYILGFINGLILKIIEKIIFLMYFNKKKS